MGMLKEFKDFIAKGNVIDLAVAVIIGAAFGAIITSLVDDVITPLILAPALKAAGAQDLNKLTWGAVKYGNFLAAVLKFLMVGFVLFLVVRTLNSMKKKKEAAVVVTPEDIILLREIRDSLRR